LYSKSNIGRNELIKSNPEQMNERNPSNDRQTGNKQTINKGAILSKNLKIQGA